MNATDQRCLVNNLQAEADGAALYRALAALESGSERLKQEYLAVA